MALGGDEVGNRVARHMMDDDILAVDAATLADFVAAKRHEGVGIDVKLLLLLGGDYLG